VQRRTTTNKQELKESAEHVQRWHDIPVPRVPTFAGRKHQRGR